MNLWILRPSSKDNPHWKPWFDKYFGFVVRAETEAEARAIANEQLGEENRNTRVWLSPTNSTCQVLSPEGGAGLIIADFAAG